MAHNPTAVLRQVIQSVAQGDPPDVTDRELLRRFAAEKDQAAFAALVRRHTNMVLGVCRRLLPTVQDAEDAVQATFLVLAQKAKSQRWQPSVANWLYTTARRVARDARVIAQRRARREARAAVTVVVPPVDRMTGRELLAALDEELDRLPPRYREPLVLCYLEGLTGDEAAARLGIPAATLRTRIIRGRKRLHDALIKGGCALGAGLLALAATSPAGASPPRLVQAVLAAASGSPPAAVAELAKGVAVNGVMNKAVLALAAAAAVAALGIGWKSLGSSAAGQPPDAGPAQVGAPEAAPPDEAPPEGVTYRGRVLGPDGKPVADAKLYLAVPWYYAKRPDPSPPFATSGQDGRFEFTVPKAIFGGRAALVVAAAANYGAGWAETPAAGSDDWTLQLVEDVPASGQLIDLQGKPVAGATLRVLYIHAAPKEDLGPWLEAIKGKNRQSHQLEQQHLARQINCSEVPGLSPKVTTDAEGRFRLTGIGRDRLAVVRLDGPAIASQELRILTRPGEVIKVPEVEANPEYGFPRIDTIYYGAAFKHAAAPAKPVVGVVRDRDTKKPLAGVKIKSYKLANNPSHGIDFIQTTTDEQGRYRLNGMPRGAGSKILFVPRDDQPYLSVHADVPDTPDFDPVTVDFDLKRGVWIEGKVTDKKTGQPLPCLVQYFALGDNPNLRDHPGYDGTLQSSDSWNVREDGTYRVVGLPGPGLVSVQHGPQYLLSDERDDAEGSQKKVLYTAPFHLLVMGSNAIARIDPARDAERVTRDVSLDPGETFRGTLLGPDGQPLAGARSYGLIPSAGWERPALETAEFTVQAFNPRRPRPVLFRHVEKGLAGLFEAPKDAGQPVTVRLQPGASVTGRLVDADGRARPNVELDVSIRIRGDSREGYSLPNKIKTDAEGRFRIDTLLPGYKFELYDRQGSMQFGDGLRSGETKDLGEVQLKRPGE